MGSNDLYRQHILDHYRNPRNYGEIDDPTYSHTGENTMCGDEITMDVELTDDDEIERITFRGDGCAISQASASMLTEELTGATVDDLQDLDRDDVLDIIGVDISPMRVKCAVLPEKVAQDGYRIHVGELTEDVTATE